MRAKGAKRTRRAKRVKQRIDGLPERLRLTIESYGSISMTAAAIKRSEGALRKWILGASEPNASDLRSICEVTGTEINWLLFGITARPDPGCGVGVADGR
jgi:DNA-binding ferritin-like protein (Dps family)